MTAPVWAEALSAGAYLAVGVLTCIAAGVRPPLRSKALAALFDLALGVSAGVLFIGVTELFFDGTVTVSGSRYVFKGAGYGHQIGMSQWGANAMAKQGFDYEDIITFYYPGVKVTRY